MRYKQIPLLVLAAICAFNASAASVGESAPQFTLPMLQQDQQVALQAFSGKVIYLDFWASWCAPCRISFPLLNRLHEKLKAQGFEVVAINLDEDKAKAEQFLKELPVGFTVLHDSNGEWADRYVVESMPTSFIIDKHGVIQHIHHGFTSDDINGLEQKITQLLSSAK
jgi:thiol-disulfide isomerase/thioredoxin